MRSFHALGPLLILSTLLTAPARADDPLPRVPEGFTIERVAASPLVKHPMLANFDERGRLFIAETAGLNLPAAELLKGPPNFIRMLEDTDGDGTFDKSTIFADGMTFPQGALWYRGALYVASPPSIWRLEDTDGDGVADRRDEIVTKFGFTGNAADIHGCFLGPDGRIYWCDGRHGHEIHDADGNLVSKGKAARIFSCRPDGSDVRVFAGGGMDNPVEIDFTEEGEILGTVNIFHGRPRGDTLVHWVEGGLYPRDDQLDCLAEFQRTGDLMPAVTNFGHVAVSGMHRYRSDALGEGFRDNVFVTQFNTHKVTRSILTRSGATFESREEEFLVSDDPDFHPTDVLEDADGSLLVIDTGGWFRIGCPVSKEAKPDIHGAIYRIRRNGAAPVDDPRGRSLNLEAAAPATLVKHLDDPRHAVREYAIDRLAQAGQRAVPELLKVMAASSTGGVAGSEAKRMAPTSASTDAPFTPTTRRNAIWVATRIPPADGITVVRAGLNDEDPSVRQTAVRALGELLRDYRDVADLPRLVELATKDEPSIRRDAATALGRMHHSWRSVVDDIRPRTIASLFDALLAAGRDRILEHAAIYALLQTEDAENIRPYLRHAHPQTRRAALIVLDQIPAGNLAREDVVPLLDTDDAALQSEALAVISRHDGWARETLALLRTWLGDDDIPAERAALLQGFLAAQASDAEVQTLVADALASAETSDAARLVLLDVVHRAPVDPLPERWTAALAGVLASPSPQVLLQAVRIVDSRRLDRFDDRLRAIALTEGSRSSLELRIEALKAIAPRLKSVDASAFGLLLEGLADETPLVQLAAARATAGAPLSDAQLVQLAGKLDAAGTLAAPILLSAFAHSKAPTVGTALVSALQESPVAASLSADELGSVLRNYPASVQTSAASLLRRLGVDLAAQQARIDELLPLADGGDPTRGRALFFGKKATCSSCHNIGGEGGRVGPDLTKIGAIRQPRDLIEAIAFPSATFAREFRTYVIVTDEGRIHTGVISRQSSDSVHLRTAELAEIRIPRESIEEMKESPTSIMPKGLDRTLTPNELRDLLAYLRSLK